MGDALKVLSLTITLWNGLKISDIKKISSSNLQDTKHST